MNQEGQVYLAMFGVDVKINVLAMFSIIFACQHRKHMAVSCLAPSCTMCVL